MKRTGKSALVLSLLLALAACATPPTDPEERKQFDEINDPAEPTNRAVFDVNKKLDDNVMKPVAVAYRDNVPEGMQHGLHNFLTNLSEPVTGLNDALQGNFGRAQEAWLRFIMNVAFGGAGFWDVATPSHMPHHDADFGQTLGVWGIPQGPFVELPLLGPSDARDAVGTGISFVVDPFFLANGGAVLTYASIGVGGGNALDQRAANIDTLDAIESTSVDYYATLRSLYRQRREALVEEGKHPDQRHGGRVDLILPPNEVPDIAPGNTP